jgi:serine/threonine protein kinase
MTWKDSALLSTSSKSTRKRSRLGYLQVMKGEPYTHTVDVYSFGITCSEVLTRTQPFQDLNDVTFAEKVLKESL